ncbi:MAG: hypothetical protein U1E30_07295 [Rhodoblastus sp.]
MQDARLARACRPAQAKKAAARRSGCIDCVADFGEQALASHERRQPEGCAGSPPRVAVRLAQLPDVTCGFKSLEPHFSAGSPADPRSRGPVRVVRDKDSARLGRLLEPCRKIDARAGELQRATLMRHDDLARMDPDANRRRAREQPEASLDFERSARGGESMLALGLIVGKHGQDAVTAYLDRRAAARLNGLRHLLDDRLDAQCRRLGVERGDNLRGALEIGEQDRRRSQLGRGSCRREDRRAAFGAIVGRMADRRSATFAS